MSGACSCQFLVRFSFAQLVTFRHLGYSAGNFEAPKGLTAIYSVACVSSYATCTQHARNIACCAAAQRCNLRCFAPSPTQFRDSQPSKQSSTILDPASTKYCKIQRCVACVLRRCCAWQDPRNIVRGAEFEISMQQFVEVEAFDRRAGQQSWPCGGNGFCSGAGCGDKRLGLA